jgi:hypothetical protein
MFVVFSNLKLQKLTRSFKSLALLQCNFPPLFGVLLVAALTFLRKITKKIMRKEMFMDPTLYFVHNLVYLGSTRGRTFGRISN